MHSTENGWQKFKFKDRLFSQTITPNVCALLGLFGSKSIPFCLFIFINRARYLVYLYVRTKWKMRTKTNKVYCLNGITHHDRQLSLWLYIANEFQSKEWSLKEQMKKKWNIFCDLKRQTRIEWCDRININHIGISRLFSPLACMSIISISYFFFN